MKVGQDSNPPQYVFKGGAKREANCPTGFLISRLAEEFAEHEAKSLEKGQGVPFDFLGSATPWLSAYPVKGPETGRGVGLEERVFALLQRWKMRTTQTVAS